MVARRCKLDVQALIDEFPVSESKRLWLSMKTREALVNKTRRSSETGLSCPLAAGDIDSTSLGVSAGARAT